MTAGTVTRGATNGNARGGSEERRRRRAWLLATFPSDIPGFCRCYRCGGLLYNPDTVTAEDADRLPIGVTAMPISVDRIIPGCKGGTYRRNNIRPACLPCNSETGGGLRANAKRSR